MNILMILSDNTFPPDIRIEKESRSLIDSGHKVYLVARGTSIQKKDEIVNNIHVHRVNIPLYNTPQVGYFSYFFIYRYFLAYQIIMIVRKNKIGALHVHDLPFGMAGVLAAKYCNLPLIFDMHEHYVDLMRSNFEVQGRAVPLLPSLLTFEEKLVCRNANKVIVVAEEQIERIATQHNIPRDKIVLVSNTADIPLLSRFEAEEKEHDIEKTKGEFIMSYIGIFSKDRGIDTLIKAIPNILKDHGNVRLLLVGVDPHMGDLGELVKSLGIDKNVIFTGWVPLSKAMKLVMESDLCTVPHLATPQRKTSLPHKLFQYMYFKKPVLVSDIPPLRRIVDQNNCGLVFEPGNYMDLAEKVDIALNEPEMLPKMGENGRKAVERHYNWNKDSKRLLAIYTELSS